MLLGVGAATVAGAPANDIDALDLFFPDTELRDSVVVRYRKCELHWARASFGPAAVFRIRRTSAAENGGEVGAAPSWVVSQWVLEVTGAAFPGGTGHTLTFTFRRQLAADKASFEPWLVRLETARWPAPGDKARLFDCPDGGGLPLDTFLAGGSAGRLTASLPRAVAQATLEALFGSRIQNTDKIVLGVDKALVWHASSPATASLYLLNANLSFHALRIERVFPDEEGAPRRTAAPARARLFADASPRRLGPAAGPVGLYAEALGPFALPSRDKLAHAFVFGSRMEGKESLTAIIDLPSMLDIRAALRHWGDPKQTIAGLVLDPSAGAGSMKPVGRLWLATSGKMAAMEPFRLAAVQIVRQADASGTVETRARLTPVGKEHVVRTSFGPIEVLAAPAVPQRSGMAARIPPIGITAVDRENERRELTAFDAVLSARCFGVRLPGRAATGAVPLGIEDDLVVRLDLQDAECRFVLPILGKPVQDIAADALVPLGPDPRGLYERAYLDLGRATLSVLRPADLLSLSFRFSGLLLEVPRLATRLGTRVLPSKGGPVCRGADPAATPPTRDGRPMLVVEFPPQHVAERAYFRAQPAPPDLPVLSLVLTDAQATALEQLRGRKPARGQDKKGEARKVRIEARTTLRGDLSVFKPEDRAFVGAFESEAAKLRLPREQQLYAGPEFVDADARRLALQLLSQREPVPASASAGTGVTAFELPTGVLKETLEPFGLVPETFDVFYFRHQDASDAVERAKDQRNSDYSLFRLRFTQQAGFTRHPLQYRGRVWFDRVRDLLPESLGAWVDGYEQALSAEPFDRVVETRLSGPSRLAFRINCDDFQSERASGGFDFSLEALTNWGSMDLAVVRRAERLVGPGSVDPAAGGAGRPSESYRGRRGGLPPRWARTVNLDDRAILAYQGISSGDHIAVEQDRQQRLGGPATARRLPAGRTGPMRRMAEVAASALQPPDPFQTAIELPFRLMLSPAQDGAFLTPNASVHRKAFATEPALGLEAVAGLYRELWSATLAGTGIEAGLRAVWSPDFRPEALLSTEAPGAPPHGPWAPWSLPRAYGLRRPPPSDLPQFRTTLDAYDRHELVALSSLHGLPVLGRRTAEGQIKDGSQYDPPDGYALEGLETIVAPAGVRTARDYSAVYRPQPLAVTELALTALGGNLDHDTSFTPPASARRQPGRWGRREANLFDALSIERWRNRTVLGRDILVEVVYKGFLFPIGHKATLVKLTERRFEASPDGGEPMAVLVQREFLRIGQPVKLFPAYGQANNGRRWPAERVTMLTRRTPDLVDHKSPAGGMVDVLTGIAFWPRTAARPGAEVKFEMLLDDEGASGSMPLLFVDNAAAHDEQAMKQLTLDYNSGTVLGKGQEQDPSGMRRLPRNGQAARMAPAAKPGDTSFTTDWWDLRVEGRESQSNAVSAANSTVVLDNQKFAIDPFMEGLDQPGFYPLVDSARCRLTQVERFTGRPSVWATVAYDGRYVASGFPESVDGSVVNEAFLCLLGQPGEPPLPMRMAGSDRAGGCAAPDLDIVGISRATGPIGQAFNNDDGSKNKDPQLKVPIPTAGGKVTLPSLSVDAGLSPNAKTFFPADAKLLGLVPLSMVLKLGAKLADQPRLKEAVEYGAAGAQATASEARAVVTDSVLRPIDAMLGEVNRLFREVAGKTLGGIGIEKAYPQIGTSLKILQEATQKALDGSLDDAAFFGSLATIYEAGRSLVAAIDGILRDPLASMSEGQAAKLRDIVEKVRGVRAFVTVLTGGVDALLSAVRNGLVDAIIDSAGWQLVLFRLPSPEGLDPALLERFESAAFGALRTALQTTLVNGAPGFDLTPLPANLAAELQKAGSDPALKAALVAAAKRIEGEGPLALSYLLAPLGVEVLGRLQAILNQVKAIQAGLKAGLAEAMTTLLKGLAEVFARLDGLLAQAALLQQLALADACRLLTTHVAPGLVNLLGALLPAQSNGPAAAEGAAAELRLLVAVTASVATPPVSRSLPGSGDSIELSEACLGMLHLVRWVVNVESVFRVDAPGTGLLPLRTLRIQLAEAGAGLATAIARIERELPWIPALASLPTAGCSTLPSRLVASLTTLTAARDEALDALGAIAEALADLPAALLAVAQSIGGNAQASALRAVIGGAFNAIPGAGVAAVRFYRAASILAAAVEDGEGGTTTKVARAGRLVAVENALRGVANELPDPAKAEITALADRLKNAPGALAGLEKQSRDAAMELRGLATVVVGTQSELENALGLASKAAKLVPSLRDQVRDVMRTAVETPVTALAGRLTLAVPDVASALAGKLAVVAEPLAGALSKSYFNVLDGRSALLKTINDPGLQGNDPFLASLVRSLQARLGEALFEVKCSDGQNSECLALPKSYEPKDRLSLEGSLAIEAAALVQSRPFDALRKLGRLVGLWGTDGPALVLLIRQFASIDGEFVRTLLLSAIDLRAVRKEIESRIRELIPARVTLPYDLDAELTSFPSEDPIFKPQLGTRLQLHALTVVHLLPQENGPPKDPEFNVTGEIGPFSIALLGKRFDVVKLNFHGLSFKAGSKVAPDMQVRFKDVKIGEKAKFLEDLQSYLSPKGDGFYIVPLRGRPGLEAGYGVNLGVIGVGTLSFSNVILAAAVRLPFGSKETAQFVVSIGRADAPFLISSTIFGGGGYLALIADSQKFVGFEASFDYGGVAAFGFGPLQGMGRLTMGIYLRQESGLTSMGATFFAGGAAHIACFGFSTSLMVRLVQEDSGPMYGSAKYSFSFSIGIDDIEFEVEVEKNEGSTMGKGGSSSAAAGSMDAPRVMLAAFNHGAHMCDVAPSWALPIAAAGQPDASGPQLRVEGTPQHRNWTAYRRYFDLTLQPHERPRRVA